MSSAGRPTTPTRGDEAPAPDMPPRPPTGEPADVPLAAAAAGGGGGGGGGENKSEAVAAEAVAADVTAPTSPERMAREKLARGTITQEEHDIILAATSRFRRLSEAADQGLRFGEDGEILEEMGAIGDADALAAAEHDMAAPANPPPISSSELASEVPIYVEAVTSVGFLSLSNDGYAILRPLDFAVPCVLVHADARKKYTPLREGDAVYLRWNSAWLRGHTTSSYMTFESGAAPSAVGKPALFRITDLVGDRSGYCGTQLKSRQVLANGTEFGLVSMYWKSSMVSAYTINPNPREPRFLLLTKPGSKKGARPLAMRCINKQYCDSRRAEQHRQRQQHLLEQRRARSAQRNILKGLSPPSTASSHKKSSSSSSRSGRSSSSSNLNSTHDRSRSTSPPMSSSSPPSASISAEHLPTTAAPTSSRHNTNITPSASCDAAAAVDDYTDPEKVAQEFADAASLLETVHTGIDSRNLQLRGEFETEILLASKSKIEAMNASRLMLEEEKKKLDTSANGGLSEEMLEMYEGIEKVIAQTRAGIDHEKGLMYFPEFEGYKYRFGSTPADSKTSMTGGVFLGLQDFMIESVRANFCVEMESAFASAEDAGTSGATNSAGRNTAAAADDTASSSAPSSAADDQFNTTGFPRCTVMVDPIKVSLVLYGVSLIGEKGSRTPDFKRPRVVVDIECVLDADFQFRPKGRRRFQSSSSASGASSSRANRSSSSKSTESSSASWERDGNPRGVAVAAVGEASGAGTGGGAAAAAVTAASGAGTSSSSSASNNHTIKTRSRFGKMSTALGRMGTKARHARTKIGQGKVGKSLGKMGKLGKGIGLKGLSNLKDAKKGMAKRASKGVRNVRKGIKGVQNRIGVRKPTSPNTKARRQHDKRMRLEEEKLRRNSSAGLHTWQIIKFSFKMDKIEFKGTPLPRSVIKMLANSILPVQIKAGLRSVLNEALGMYLRDTPGQRCFLQGELTIDGTPLEVLDANVGDALGLMFDQSGSISGHHSRSGSAGSAEAAAAMSKAKSLSTFAEALDLLGGLSPEQAAIFFSMGERVVSMGYDVAGPDSTSDCTKWKSISDMFKYMRTVKDKCTSDDEWTNLLCAWQRIADALAARSGVKPFRVARVFWKVSLLRRKPIACCLKQRVCDVRGDAGPAIGMFRSSVEASMQRLIAARISQQQKRAARGGASSMRNRGRGVKGSQAADALAVRKATAALREIEAWERQAMQTVQSLGSTVRRLRGNLLGTLKGGSKGVLDLCGDSLTIQLPSGFEQNWSDAVLEKSPLSNLIHVEEDEGGRFFFDLAVDPDEIDEDWDDEGTMTSSRMSMAPATMLRTLSSANPLSASMVNDAVERVYDHDDDFLRIMSISLRRSRLDWQVDREKMIAMLMADDGEGVDYVNLFSMDMALRGIDDDDAEAAARSAAPASVSAAPAVPSYLLQTTRLPFSRLVWTVLDYRILGPPWRITQYMTGTMKKSTELVHQDFERDNQTSEAWSPRGDGVNAVGENMDDRGGAETELKTKNAPDLLEVCDLSSAAPVAAAVASDAAGKENTASWEIAMDTVRRYLRSPDLSVRFSVSVSMDAEEDDDLSFFYDDEMCDGGDGDRAVTEGEGKEGTEATTAGGGDDGGSTLESFIASGNVEPENREGDAEGEEKDTGNSSNVTLADAATTAAATTATAAATAATAATATASEQGETGEEEEGVTPSEPEEAVDANLAFAIMNWHGGASYRPKTRRDGQQNSDPADGASDNRMPDSEDAKLGSNDAESNALVVKLKLSIMDVIDDVARILAAD